VVHVCCHVERWRLAVVGRGYDVDHEVFARLNRFKVNQNVVINMVWAWTLRTGWGVSHCACHGSGRVSWRHYGWAPTRIGGNADREVADQSLDHLRLGGIGWPLEAMASEAIRARQKHRDLTASNRYRTDRHAAGLQDTSSP
jgi:hypothetical protein